MKIIRQISLLLLISLIVAEIDAQQRYKLDTILVQEFLEWKFNSMYHGNGNICNNTLPVGSDFFDCTPIEYYNGKPTIPPVTKGIACRYLNSKDLMYMKGQINATKNVRLDSFEYLKSNFKLINCDSITTRIVTHQFSIPLFSIDKKTALLVYSDETSNSAGESYHIELYKKDDQNKWRFFVELFRSESD